MEIIKKSHSNENNDDDDVDLDIPMLIKKTTKLKSFDFANRQSFLFNNFKDIDVERESKPSAKLLMNDAANVFKPFKEIDCVNKEDTINKSSPKISSTDNDNEQKLLQVDDDKEKIIKKFVSK